MNECHILLGISALAEVHQYFDKIAQQWTQVATWFENIGKTQDIALVNQCTDLLSQLSVQEHQAMTQLQTIAQAM